MTGKCSTTCGSPCPASADEGRAKGIFVTGTDTGVGKTVAAAVIARLLAERGLSVGVMKPVTSGCLVRDGRRISEDAEILLEGAGCDLPPEDVAPYVLKDPIAPSAAAAREGVRIDFRSIREAYDRIAAVSDFVVVEGAGGLMVPLAGGFLVADLATALDLPLLVVARPDLGTVNHTVLTCFAARQMDIPVKGIVINGWPETPGDAEETAPHLISSLSGAPVLGIFPKVAQTEPAAMIAELADRVSREPATKFLIRTLLHE